MTIRPSTRLVAALAGLTVALSPAVAHADLYWTNAVDGTIGRSANNGTGVTGADQPIGLTLLGRYLYWTNYGLATIGRGRLNGTGVNQSHVTGVTTPFGLTAGAGRLFWASTPNNAIGRAKLDGSGVTTSFITGANSPYGIDEFTAVPASVTARVTARKGKLSVRVGPRLPPGQQWTFQVQQRRDGGWRFRTGDRRTEGTKHTRTLNLPAGTYRVQAGFGFLPATSDKVKLQR